MKSAKTRFAASVLTASLSASFSFAATPDMASKSASPATLAVLAQVRASLPQDDGQDDDFVHRGFIANPKESKFYNQNGKLVWDVEMMDWVKGDAPPTVNPSLWRQTRLLKEHGLFKVTDGVWQVRGFDMSNMEIVQGKTGWIIIDPLMNIETAAAAIKLVKEQLGDRPVTGVIYGHSHADHFGGVRAVVTPGTTPVIIAPEGAVREAASETVLVGNSMQRRAAYQLGVSLKPDPRGYVGSGILIESPENGLVTIIPPTDEIKKTGETREIDGVKFEFQMVPETEAPSEMNVYLPEHKTLYVSEDTTCTMHNVQTPRGALVRDALKWAGFITEQINLWGDQVESLVTGHCWPRFGNAAIKNYLSLQRDNYKFIHDQTVRRLNMGQTPTEIASELKQPKALTDLWSNRGYYGKVNHNAKGVYQRYVGWWDGIPAHLNLLPPVEQGKHYLRMMGGARGILKEARRAMAEGDYRWSAEILNHVVFAEPGNRDAVALLADTYEQLGYQEESGIFRNYYLTGASELRGGQRKNFTSASPEIIKAMPTESFLGLLAARLNPDKIGDRAMTVVMDEGTDGEKGGKSLVTLHNSVLVPEVGKSIDVPTVTVSGTRLQLMGLFIRKTPLDKMEAAGLNVGGDRAALVALLDAIEVPPTDFAIVTP